MWKNLLHPSINRTKFTAREDSILQDLAATSEERLWDEVALELNRATGQGDAFSSAPRRTGFQCFKRYQDKFGVVARNRRFWSVSEDEKLKKLVAVLRINNYIPWTKVAYYMERRTKDQCYQRYVYSLRDNIKKGILYRIQ